MKKWIGTIGLVLVLAANGAAGTFNGNNLADIFLTNASGLHWYETTGAGYTMGYKSGIVNLTNATAVAVGNFDGDDRLDLFLGKSGTSGTWYESDGADWVEWRGNFGSSAAKNGLAVIDYDGDGFGDVLQSRTTGYWDWYEATGNNTVGYVTGSTVGAVSISAGDLDGDGYTDLFLGRSGGLQWNESLSNNTQAFVRTLSAIPNVKASVMGDFDGDSRTDLFVVKSDGNLMWYKGGNGDNAIPQSIGVDLLSGVTTLAMGDVNGDGVMNLLVGTTNGVNIYKAAGTALDYVGSFGSGEVYDIAIVSAVVPEPATLMLLGIGSLLLKVRRR